MQKKRLGILLISTLAFPSTLLVATFPAIAQTPSLRNGIVETQRQRAVCVNERSAQLAASELSPSTTPQIYTFNLRSPAGRYATVGISVFGDGFIKSVKVYGKGAMCYSQESPTCELKVWSNSRDRVSNCSSGVLCVNVNRQTNIVGGGDGSVKNVCGGGQDQNLPLKLQRMGCQAPINIREGMTAQQVQAEDSQYYWCFK